MQALTRSFQDLLATTKLCALTDGLAIDKESGQVVYEKSKDRVEQIYKELFVQLDESRREIAQAKHRQLIVDFLDLVTLTLYPWHVKDIANFTRDNTRITSQILWLRKYHVGVSKCLAIACLLYSSDEATTTTEENNVNNFVLLQSMIAKYEIQVFPVLSKIVEPLLQDVKWK